jgi:Fic family protein
MDPIFLSLPLESVIRDNQADYYAALEAADQQSDSTPFVVFMLEVIEDTLIKNAPVSAPANAPVNLRN